MLGEIYYNILQDNDLAIKYLKKAIENGDKESIILIVTIYVFQENMEEANKYGLMYDILKKWHLYFYRQIQTVFESPLNFILKIL